MARHKTICPHCDARFDAGASFCARCGQPTIWASPDDRVAWELNDWRAHGTRARATVHTPILTAPRAERVPVRAAPAPAAAPARPVTIPIRPSFASPSPLVMRPAVIDLRTPAVDPQPVSSPEPPAAHLLVEAIGLLREMTERMARLDERLSEMQAGGRAHGRFGFLRRRA